MFRIIGKFYTKLKDKLSPGVSLWVQDFNLVTKIESGLTPDPKICKSWHLVRDKNCSSCPLIDTVGVDFCSFLSQIFGNDD